MVTLVLGRNVPPTVRSPQDNDDATFKWKQHTQAADICRSKFAGQTLWLLTFPHNPEREKVESRTENFVTCGLRLEAKVCSYSLSSISSTCHDVTKQRKPPERWGRGRERDRDGGETLRKGKKGIHGQGWRDKQRRGKKEIQRRGERDREGG